MKLVLGRALEDTVAIKEVCWTDGKTAFGRDPVMVCLIRKQHEEKEEQLR